MNRHLLLGLALGLSLLAGCAATGDAPGGDSELVERIRQELALDPLLNSSSITVTERDGEVVIAGFADKLEDIEAIRDVIESVDGVRSVENNVTLRSGG